MCKNHRTQHTTASNQPLPDASPTQQDSPELNALLSQWADHVRGTQPPNELLPRARRRRAQRIWLHRSAAAMILLTISGGLWSIQTGIDSINGEPSGNIARTNTAEPPQTDKSSEPTTTQGTPTRIDNTANNSTAPAIVESDRAILEPIKTQVPGVTIVWYFPVKNTPAASPTGQSTHTPDHKLAEATPCNTLPIQPI